MSRRKIKRFKHVNVRQRGIATGVHNSVLEKLRAAEAKNRLLEQLLASIVHTSERDPLTVELVPIPGHWTLLLTRQPDVDFEPVRFDLSLSYADPGDG